ncbi:MAG TPA: chorismate synthase [Thermoplasmata archaeon]|nr:chorismate synthase [Thermoplasmata archaeon]
MMGWGERFHIELFGSSHGPEVGVTIDGIPAGTPIDPLRIQRELDRRRPLGRRLATRRQEPDQLVIDSGLGEGRSDGGRFRAHVANVDVQRGAYDKARSVPRPGHADFPARVRYGPAADLSGGGIFSGRMTVGLVIAGTIARSLWERKGVEFVAFTRSIGTEDGPVPDEMDPAVLRSSSARNEVGAVEPAVAGRMAQQIEAARRAGDSIGGVIECRILGLPVGVGEPFFDSVESAIAHLALSIPAVKGVEFGAGFAAARLRGSAHNDPFVVHEGHVSTSTNHAGGILGGLSVGTAVVFRVAVKPTSSIAKEQSSVDLTTMRPTTLKVAGRHDPCIVPRAVPVVEAAAAIALADLGLRGGFLP